MAFTPLDLLQAFLLFQALLLAALLIRKKPLWPLSALLVTLALHMLWNLGCARVWPLPNIRPGLSFLYGPLLLAMVKRLAWRDQPALSLVHFVPALVAPWVLVLWPQGVAWMWPTIALTMLSYLGFAFVELMRYERVLKSTHAANEMQTLRWLRDCLIGMTVVALADFSRLLLPASFYRFDFWFNTATYLVALTLIVYLLWRGWHQSERFPGLAAVDAAVAFERGKASQQQLVSQEALAEWAAQLDELLQRSRLFLDPELTASQLAQQLGWPVKQLSTLLSQHYGRNFNDFINTARVAAACELLCDPQRCEDKLLAIQLDSGFASKSVFYASFKRVTGLTPHQWRTKHLPASA